MFAPRAVPEIHGVFRKAIHIYLHIDPILRVRIDIRVHFIMLLRA